MAIGQTACPFNEQPNNSPTEASTPRGAKKTAPYRNYMVKKQLFWTFTKIYSTKWNSMEFYGIIFFIVKWEMKNWLRWAERVFHPSVARA